MLNKNEGSLGLICTGIIFFSFIHLYFNNLTYAFFICIVVIVNPGGIFSEKPFGIDTHFIRLQDLYFYLSILFFYTPKLKHIKLSSEIKKILPIIIVFTFYQIIVSILFNLNISSIANLLKTIEGYKLWLFGIYILIPTYKIVQLDSKLFLKTLATIALFFAFIVLVSVYTPLEIVSFNTGERGIAERIMIQNAEIFKLLIYVSFGILIINYCENNKVLYYLVGILSFFVLVIGMFRLEMMYTIATLLIVFYFLTKNNKVNISKVFKVIVFVFVFIILLFISFPKFSYGIVDAYTSTFNEVSGKVAMGSTQTRTIIELPKQLWMIQTNPYLGVGFRKEWWLNYINKLDWGLSDIPITSTIAMYGIIGMLIYYSRFYVLIGAIRKANKLIRNNITLFNVSNKLEIVVISSIGAYIIAMISFRLFYIGWELTIIKLQAEFGIYIGLFYGLINKLNLVMNEKNQDFNS